MVEFEVLEKSEITQQIWVLGLLAFSNEEVILGSLMLSTRL